MAKLTSKEKERRRRNRKKGCRDFFIKLLAFLMVAVTLFTIIMPVAGPLRELFHAIGEKIGPYTQGIVTWFQQLFQGISQWFSGLF